LAQEVFVKLFARLDRYEAQAGIPFEHWVSRLTVRTCLDALRAERRRPELRCSDLGEEENQWLEFLLNAAAPAPETPRDPVLPTPPSGSAWRGRNHEANQPFDYPFSGMFCQSRQQGLLIRYISTLLVASSSCDRHESASSNASTTDGPR
jgi:hypothetical protein